MTPTTKTDDGLRDELEDFDGEYPESWIPDVGDILVGEVLRYDSGSTDYGRHPICVLEDEATGEERGVWLLHTVLLEEFKQRRPKPGERVGIKRLPDAEKGYKRYAVRVDREEPEVPDFDAFSDPGDVPPGEDPTDPEDDFSEDALMGGDDDLPF